MNEWIRIILFSLVSTSVLFALSFLYIKYFILRVIKERKPPIEQTKEKQRKDYMLFYEHDPHYHSFIQVLKDIDNNSIDFSKPERVRSLLFTLKQVLSHHYNMYDDEYTYYVDNVGHNIVKRKNIQ